jgi:sporulation-control protein spo0M
MSMLTDYMKKLNIGLPKAVVHLNQDEYTLGSAINGQLEIRGGFIKNVLKRYEIDLVREALDSQKEEILNNRSVYCSKECLPNKIEVIPFIVNVPENMNLNQLDSYTYSLIVRIVLENSQTVLNKHPLTIQN